MENLFHKLSFGFPTFPSRSFFIWFIVKPLNTMKNEKNTIDFVRCPAKCRTLFLHPTSNFRWSEKHSSLLWRWRQFSSTATSTRRKRGWINIRQFVSTLGEWKTYRFHSPFFLCCFYGAALPAFSHKSIATLFTSIITQSSPQMAARIFPKL